MKANTTRFWTIATIMGCLTGFLVVGTASADNMAPAAPHAKKVSSKQSYHHHSKPKHPGHQHHPKTYVNYVSESQPVLTYSQPRSVRVTYDVYHNGSRYGSYFSLAEAQEVMAAVKTYRGGQVYITTFSW